jgi:hypothetical protein
MSRQRCRLMLGPKLLEQWMRESLSQLGLILLRSTLERSQLERSQLVQMRLVQRPQQM